ncbi:MAG TPA: ABC transporter permease [Arenimonas sp.]|nr:ABC transporter permease [Arenimonas sp.]HOZ04818.1 ABC transporter permease [Arenimonas sp.]HPW32098.1 ABC transporter permease [Arenimonas sp.]
MNDLAPFEWILATRFMREGLLQTLFIIAGVALGVSVIVFMSALLTGLQSSLFSRTLDFQAQIIITAPEEIARPLYVPGKGEMSATLIQPRAQRLRSVDQWQKVRAQIEKKTGVVVVTPVVSGAGFVIRADANRAVTLTGIEPETYLHLIALKDKIVAGNAEVGSNDIVIGTELAKDMGVSINDKITMQTASGATSTLKVLGIYDFGNKAANSRSVYVALRTAQSLLNLPGGATTLEVNVADPFAAELMAQSIQAQTGLKAESWITANEDFFTALSGQSFTFLVIRLFVGLTAALGIASVLVVSVVQKSKEIGILRATGTTRQQILRLFLTQGALFGLFGSLLGSGLGWAFLAAWRGFAKNPDGTLFFAIDFDPLLFLYAAIGAVLVGTLAAVFPAQRAARLDPAVAIRG